jgi:hypothetical protein
MMKLARKYIVICYAWFSLYLSRYGSGNINLTAQFEIYLLDLILIYSVR